MSNFDAMGANKNHQFNISGTPNQSIGYREYSQKTSNSHPLMRSGSDESDDFHKIDNCKFTISRAKSKLTNIEFKIFLFKLKNLLNKNKNLHTEKNLLSEKIELLEHIKLALSKLIPLYEGKVQNTIERRTESSLIFKERHTKYTKKIEHANTKMEKLEAKISKSDSTGETTPLLQ